MDYIYYLTQFFLIISWFVYFFTLGKVKRQHSTLRSLFGSFFLGIIILFCVATPCADIISVTFRKGNLKDFIKVWMIFVIFFGIIPYFQVYKMIKKSKQS